jgi:hypothetical protein
MKFGEFVRERRLASDLGLREFCRLAETDASNWSKIERDAMPAPSNRDFLESVAELLKLKKGSQDWYTFFDLAAISQQKIPHDVYADEQVLSTLPVFFRTVRGEKPSQQELDNLIKLLKRR